MLGNKIKGYKGTGVGNRHRLFPDPIRICLALLIFISAAWGCGWLKGKKDINVVLITLDTTRSDYVDTGTGARAFTPALYRFSGKAVVFENAFSTIPQTLPSHLSILTSHFPHECGVLDNQYIYGGRFKMLQEILKEKGYETAAVVSLGTISGDTGIAGGFDVYRENLNDKGLFYADAEKVTREAGRLLEERKNRKFFLFLHYSDPHSPYAPPTLQGRFKIEVDGKTVVEFNPYRGAILRQTIPLTPGPHEIRFKVEPRPNCPADFKDFDAFAIRRLTFSENCSVSFSNIEFSETHYKGAHLLRGEEGFVRVRCSGEAVVKIFQVIPLLSWRAAVDFYRQEVEYMDRWVGTFLNKLECEGLMDNTAVIITADHGEGLGERERYFGHVRYLNRQFIQVPLLVYLPGVKPARVHRPVSLAGVAPTLLEYLGIRHPHFDPGKNILNRTKKDKGVYSFAFYPSAVEDKFSVIRWPYQDIFSREETGGSGIGYWSEMYHLGLSQSFRKWDEYSPAVVMRTAGKRYAALQQDFRRWRWVFKRKSMAKLNTRMKMEPAEIEKLKTMGYFH